MVCHLAESTSTVEEKGKKETDLFSSKHFFSPLFPSNVCPTKGPPSHNGLLTALFPFLISLYL
jgi:hypothetical protein